MNWTGGRLTRPGPSMEKAGQISGASAGGSGDRQTDSTPHSPWAEPTGTPNTCRKNSTFSHIKHAGMQQHCHNDILLYSFFLHRRTRSKNLGHHCAVVNFHRTITYLKSPKPADVHLGVLASQEYRLDPMTFANGTVHPPNDCYDNNLPSGVQVCLQTHFKNPF